MFVAKVVEIERVRVDRLAADLLPAIRDAWAWLIPPTWAMVRRLSSAVVSANRAGTRPLAPGTMALIGRTKSTPSS